LCPRGCGVDRTTGGGFCGAADTLEVASVCVHRGEEPPLNPIVNVFFAHCNLQCIYCQNWQISGKGERLKVKGERYSTESLADLIVSHLSPLTSHLSPLLGLVTASHYAHHIPALIDAVHQRGFTPTVVYNSSGYESVETLRSLEGLVDIYLPDFKYMDTGIAKAYSHAPDYPEVASAALREMIRQVGKGLKVDGNGTAYRGLIVRHLVLPGHVDNSLAVLDHLADLVPFGLHLSLMAQYFPPKPGLPAPLDRSVTADEYAVVVARAEELGLTDGWIQELAARDNYRPDFSITGNPFERNDE
jgi:putative pyruvate formate lyase activating enzyme